MSLLQTHLNLLTHVLVEVGQLDRVLDVLREKLCVPSEDGSTLGLPREAWPQLLAAVQSSTDVELKQKLEVGACYAQPSLLVRCLFLYRFLRKTCSLTENFLHNSTHTHKILQAHVKNCTGVKNI